MELQSFEKPYGTLLNSANWATGGPILTTRKALFDVTYVSQSWEMRKKVISLNLNSVSTIIFVHPKWLEYISVPQSPNLMNSARLHKVFQNFVVPWKIHKEKSNSIIRRVLTRRVEWYKGCLCKFLRQIDATTGSKITIIYEKCLKKKKLNRPLSFRPPIAPGT
jgi:hypothetical protein